MKARYEIPMSDLADYEMTVSITMSVGEWREVYTSLATAEGSVEYDVSRLLCGLLDTLAEATSGSYTSTPHDTKKEVKE